MFCALLAASCAVAACNAPNPQDAGADSPAPSAAPDAPTAQRDQPEPAPRLNSPGTTNSPSGNPGLEPPATDPASVAPPSGPGLEPPATDPASVSPPSGPGLAPPATGPAPVSPAPAAPALPSQTTAQDIDSLVRANNSFALDLYGQLADQSGNLFFSPYSISSALAMTWSGASGVTAQEMADTLHFRRRPIDIAGTFQALDRNLAAPHPGYQLRIANRLWGQRGYEFDASFLAITEGLYGAPLADVDFASTPDVARERINGWVAERTDDRILDLVPPNAIDTLTRLVLTNAIYFKGTWLRQFDPAVTANAPFHLADGSTRPVPLMFLDARFGYARRDNVQILRLPYEGDTLSMIVLLPGAAASDKAPGRPAAAYDGDGVSTAPDAAQDRIQADGAPSRHDDLASLEASLDADRLSTWIAELRDTDVQVHLPRFDMTSDFSLKKVLTALGMTTAFDPDKADFTAMLGRRELYISAAIHKAFVEVNEEGTEAAAATAVAMGIESVREVEVFRADRPFLFLIRDDQTGSILFVGRLADPTG